jgi:ribosomal-protein-alanine N-acetyltransferase
MKPAPPLPRAATVEDAATLAALHAAAFDRPWDAAAFARLVDDGALVRIAGAPAIGFIAVATVLDEAEVLTLAVAPAARGRGVGRALLEAAMSAAAGRGAARCWLEVGEGNVAARALYAKAGFAPIGRRKAYYSRADGTREDALTLSRALDAAPGNGP